MSETNRSRRLAVIALVLVSATLIPVVVRHWPDVRQLLPISAKMLGETAILLVAVIGVAGLTALLFTRYLRRNGDA